MEEEIDLPKILSLGTEKVKLGRQLVNRLAQLSNVDGVSKVQRKINQEIKFLTGVSCLSNITYTDKFKSNETFSYRK